MDARQQRLQHLPFFEVLGNTEENSDDWRTISAGLVTLRLFDNWLRFGTEVVRSENSGLRAVRETIAAVSAQSPVRTILTSIVDSMQTAPSVQPARVLPRLLAYARALQFEARWSLAIDVYRTVVLHTDPFHEPEIVIAANMRIGSCYRTLGDFRSAATAYRAAGELAAATNDIVNVLRSRIEEAKLAIDRGNLPRAEVMLDETIRQAEERGLTDIRATALHDRMVVAFRRKDFESATQFAYRALQDTHEQTSRDRVLGDIAACFVELGLRSAARDAYLIVAATAREQYVRWTATISLMEIAALEGREPVFERYRRELEDASLPPNLSAYYYYYVGLGQQLFNRFAQARAAIKRAIEISSVHQLNQISMEAEELLRKVEAGEAAQVRAHNAEAPANVLEVTLAIREMRELAGVGD